jgi:hypothetical protein
MNPGQKTEPFPLQAGNNGGRKEKFPAAFGLLLPDGNFKIDLARSNFPQAQDYVFVVGFIFDQGLSPLVELLGSFRGHHDQQKPVGNLLETIFNCNTCHIGFSFTG